MLLLVDTSGSMEYKTSSNSFPICRYDTTGVIPSAPATSERSRWIDLIEVLTGSITNYQCQTIDRGSASFKSEYKLAASSPYDFLYANPYHRPLSGTCAPGPGTVSSTNPADFLANSFNYHTYNNTAASCSFDQSPDGILDAFQENLRFALMTFDTDPSADKGEPGTFSYIVGSSHQGMPVGCTKPTDMEVGARNASAPPWEGRLVPFGDPQPGSSDYLTKNQQIQQVLRASRPYGATPIAGMLSDARDFLRNDTTDDPVNPAQKFGPSGDPYASCRKTRVILLSDGQPNLDLRGHCTGSGCPFDLPENIAKDLLTATATSQSIKTFVIGFALNNLTIDASTTIDCATLNSANLDTTCNAHPENSSLQACCNLARIALMGDDAPNRHAFFANDREGLRRDISTVLSEALPSTSRTQAAFSGAAGATASTAAPAASYRFFSDFSPVLLQPWSGHVTRERWTCDDAHQPVRIPPDSGLGDSFADNLNSRTGIPRTFYTVQPASGGVFADRTIRPSLSGNPDGAGSLTGTLTSGNTSTFVSNTLPASMGLDDTSCTTTVGTVVTAQTAAQCRDKYLKWLVGEDNGTTFSRCPNGTCNLLGDIFHATPRIVNAPRELISDDTFQNYQKTYATRPLTLYTSSNDGMLHAFKVASNLPGDSELIDSKKSNELWAFIPPEVLPHLSSEYPYTHQMLLDGVSVTKDVVARKVGTSYVLERSTSDASDPANATWRTILVQGFGNTFPGYFALDVSNPDPRMTIDGQVGGPRFLWQLSSDESGTPLFGTGGATPIITTLAVDEDGSGVKEVAVAVLPGGSGSTGGPGTGSGCTRGTSTTDLNKIGGGVYTPRDHVPCYTTNLGARSLTIVRLDTGKIIRTFRRDKSEVPAAIQARVIPSPIDSPITGEPVAFPTDVGSVAERLFVGDQDGTLWKVDVSNKSPDLWTMSLFWDAFPNTSIHVQPKGAWNTGQPIATAPLLSVDIQGNLTIAISTGSQGNLGAQAGMQNFVWSLRDLPNAARDVFSADLLWVQQFLDGERVTGPISLFNSYLYFSTVTPPAANAACKSSNGAKIWGMHFVTPLGGEGNAVTAAVRDVGGLPAPFIKTNFNSTNQFVTDVELLGTGAQSQAVIYGVTVAQVPTCFATDTSTDAYSPTKISAVNPGKFQLLVQTGTASLGTGGKGEAVTPPGAVAVTLPNLATPARVEAWAALVE